VAPRFAQNKSITHYANWFAGRSLNFHSIPKRHETVDQVRSLAFDAAKQAADRVRPNLSDHDQSFFGATLSISPELQQLFYSGR